MGLFNINIDPKAKADELAKKIADMQIQKEQVEKSLQEQAVKISKIAQKVKPSTGKILSYAETILIFVIVYLLTPVLMYMDIVYKTILGQSIATFFEKNLDAVIYIFTLLQAIFVLKTFTKSQELKVDEVMGRQEHGRGLVMFLGVGIFVLYLVVYPVISKYVPYVTTFYQNITWSTILFIFTIAGLYIGNKLVFTANKDDLIAQMRKMGEEEPTR